jgi:aminopeptidase N
VIAALALSLFAASGLPAADPFEDPILTSSGISLELARYRAATLSDVRYDLHFRLPGQRDAPVVGSLDLTFARTGDGPLILDFADPSAVGTVRVNGEVAEVERIHNHLVLPAASLRNGENRVRLEFNAGDGPLNRHDDFLYTLFVPARAHEAFPAFDQPDIRARFRLTLTVPDDWAAVANGEAIGSRRWRDEVEVRFAETEPIPTYLFSFAAGRFQVAEAERSGRRIRIFHRETDPENVARNLPTIFDLHETSLEWLEEYTGIPYPFGKFDLVAIPAFQYNGMEHPGAILYRASSLFLDESATRAEELGRASLIAHETAHMWFGNLVTMPWFDDVWMKEVFANFMAARIVHPSFPEIDHQLRFLLAHYPAAYGVDRTPGANAIRQQLENLDDAASLYGAIIYQKAPIVMRQLELLMGEESLRAAVRRYLREHAFGNAGWPDLVAILDDLTPLDVRAWSRVWVEEPGRPTIVAERGPDHLTLRQRDDRGRGLVWEQRSVVRQFHGPDSSEHIVSLGPDPVRVDLLARGDATNTAVLPNAAGIGYGLFILDPITLPILLTSLHTLPDPVARAAGWITLLELMFERAVQPADLMGLATRFIGEEEDELVLQAVLGALPELVWRWTDPAARERDVPGLERLLWERMGGAHEARTKAALFNAWRDVAYTPQAIQTMERIWTGKVVVPGLQLAERDLTTLALHLAVRDAPAADSILDAQAARIDNPDRRARFDFVRAAADPDPAVRDAFFARLARPEARAREEWVVAALQYLHHPLRAHRSLPYLRPALDLLREVRDTGDIFFPKRWLDATLGGHASADAAAIIRSFLEEVPGDYPPRLLGKLLQSADPVLRSAPQP